MQTLTPTAVILSNLSGSVTDLDDSPDAPDANWCTGSAGTYLSIQASTMDVGEWKQITTNDLSTDLFTYSANNTLDYCDKGNYDPINKQVRFIGQAHMGDQRWHCYDEATNAWSNLADPPWDDGGTGGPSFLGHGYHHNTIDPATGDDYFRQYNDPQPRRLNRATSSWSQLPSIGGMTVAGGLEWLPTIGTQGGLVLHAGPAVAYWDKADNDWTTPAGDVSEAGGYHNFVIRNPVANVVYFGGGNDSAAVYTINGSGTVAQLTDCPINLGVAATVTTVCPESGNLLVIASNASAYKYSGGSWSSLSMTGAPTMTAGSGAKIIAIPIAAYGVIMFLLGGTPAVWLYRHA